jgi:hypothetical protein
MPKNLPVASLQLGDRFEFLMTQVEGSKPAIMIVTRAPAVNTIANSCHFRYQPAATTDDTVRKWDDNSSWNGTPNVLVRILERPTPDPAANAAPIAAVPPTKAAPQAKAAPQEKAVLPTKTAPPTKSVAKAKAVRQTKADAPRKKKASKK